MNPTPSLDFCWSTVTTLIERIDALEREVARLKAKDVRLGPRAPLIDADAIGKAFAGHGKTLRERLNALGEI